jgi:hypothetical protein
MKCLKNITTGNIIRVDDRQANQMAGKTWKYVPKEEWKSVTRVKTEKQEVESEKKEETVNKKLLRRQKLKAKQQ